MECTTPNDSYTIMREKLIDLAIKMVLQEEIAYELSKAIKSSAKSAYTRTNRTMMVEVDLTKPHQDYPLNLDWFGKVYRWLTIERCDGTLNYRLKQVNGTLSNVFRALEGSRIYQHDFIDIYVSNPASNIPNAVCRFIVGYWED